MFSFIPMHCVVVNSHLFLRMVDVFINLLLRDLRIVDGIEKATGIDLEKTRQPMLKLTKCFSMTHARFDFSGTQIKRQSS